MWLVLWLIIIDVHSLDCVFLFHHMYPPLMVTYIFQQLVDAEQKSMDLGNDVNILSQMLNSREGSLSITQNDLGFVLYLIS